MSNSATICQLKQRLSAWIAYVSQQVRDSCFNPISRETKYDNIYYREAPYNFEVGLLVQCIKKKWKQQFAFCSNTQTIFLIKKRNNTCKYLGGKTKNDFFWTERIEELTGGPSSGGMMILRFPPGLMSRTPSSNPALFFWLFSINIEHRDTLNGLNFETKCLAWN